MFNFIITLFFQPRQKMLAAAGRVGDYSHAMIHTMQEPSDSEKEFQVN